jgi:hypothetical protein
MATTDSTSRDPLHISNASNLTQLERHDYPHVKFWTRKEWEAEKENDGSMQVNQAAPCRGKTRMANGENVALKFVEDQHGNSVDGIRVGKIREFARTVWTHLRDFGQAPPTWKQGSHLVQTYYRSQMYTNFPELRLCDSHWKVDQIATSSYSGWYRTHGTRTNDGLKAKKEPEVEIIEDTQDQQTEKKRPAGNIPHAPGRPFKIPRVQGKAAPPSTSSTSSNNLPTVLQQPGKSFSISISYTLH